MKFKALFVAILASILFVALTTSCSNCPKCERTIETYKYDPFGGGFQLDKTKMKTINNCDSEFESDVIEERYTKRGDKYFERTTYMCEVL